MDKKLKQLKETWNRLDEFMKVHDYRDGSYFGSGTYSFDIGDHQYVMGADDFTWKGIPGLDVAFGVMRTDEKIGHYVDYDTTLNDVDATDVIATVLDMTMKEAQRSIEGNEWLLSFNPTKDTDDSQEGEETKRAKLYQRVTKRMANKYGWDVVDIMRMDKHNIGFLMKRK